MTKVYVAKPPEKPKRLGLGGSSYQISPEAMAITPQPVMEESTLLTATGKGGSKYITDAGAEFSFELNILDTASKKPIRGVEIKVGESKGFTDRIGRAVFRLPFGRNTVQVSGSGYVEAGEFAPRPIQFEPRILELDLDSDSIYTLYSTGELVPGERRELDNPGPSFDLEAFLRDNWKILGIVGGGAVTAFFLGKRKKE